MDDDRENRQLIAHRSSTKLAPAQRDLIRSVVAYEPVPIPRPQVDEEFDKMSVGQSTLEAFRYSAFLLEYTLSPNGWLRAWLVICCRLFLLLVVPTVGTTLLLQLVVPLAAQVAAVAGQLEIAARATVVALAWLVLGVLFLGTLITVMGGKKRGRR